MQGCESAWELFSNEIELNQALGGVGQHVGTSLPAQ